jgi:hypothetical protein
MSGRSKNPTENPTNRVQKLDNPPRTPLPNIKAKRGPNELVAPQNPHNPQNSYEGPSTDFSSATVDESNPRLLFKEATETSSL